MQCHIVLSGLEAVHRVTALAQAFVGAVGELAAMNVLMTVRTVVMREWFRHVAARVTLGANHRNVFAQQRVIGLVVIKGFADDLLKALRRVTGLAVLAELVFVGILMTRHTVAEVQTAVSRHRAGALSFGELSSGEGGHGFEGVAFRAVHVLMFSGQRIACFLVREFRRGRPRFVGMAGDAIVRELIAVLVFVTIETGGTHAEEGALAVGIIVRPDGNIGDEGRFVAIAAVGFAVRAFELVPSKRMIKALLALLPMNQLEFAAVMFGVTFCAGATFDFAGAMVTGAGIDPALQCLMTCETLGG